MSVRVVTTLYLPVNVDGALLALSDGRARQSDGNQRLRVSSAGVR